LINLIVKIPGLTSFLFNFHLLGKGWGDGTRKAGSCGGRWGRGWGWDI
jgi:hypothetical protein